MQNALNFEIEHNRKRLEYYNQLKQKLQNDKSAPGSVDKWISIYSERLQKLEKQATKIGLKTQLAGVASQSRSA